MNLAFVAASIAVTLVDRNIVYLTDDEQEAERLAAAVRAIVPGNRVFHVPSTDALPGDTSLASPANAGQRVAALRQMRLAQLAEPGLPYACILSAEAAARRYAKPLSFDTAPPVLRVGDPVEASGFGATVEALGYFTDDRVDEPGEMAVRGDVVDIFPADAVLPVRLEFSDGSIIAIRSYDPVTQRTVGELGQVEVGRAAEPPLDEASSILDHLEPGVIARSAKAVIRRQRFLQLASDAARSGDSAIDAIDDATWDQALIKWESISFEENFEAVPRFAEDDSPASALKRFVLPLLADHGLVLAGSERDLRFLRAQLGRRLSVEFPTAADWVELGNTAPGTGSSVVMPVDQGFVSEHIVLLTAANVLGSRALLDDHHSLAVAKWGAGGTDIRIGDVVVHEDHGVAQVLGLEPDPNDENAEMVALEYLGGARRLVATDDADRLWRYGADVDAVALDKLDGSTWQKRRQTIDATIAETARGLTSIAQARAELSAPKMIPDIAAYERFVANFPFNETADQVRAIAAVRDDLASGKPMDRLIVGDVGYGKTEVALRAAALTALAGHQVIVSAPTTVLVRQHLETFSHRFAGTDVTVVGLSRLSSAAEKKAIKAGLADGSIDIVVGTGAVIAKGVAYARLGLVIIDEEQRFGAVDKARLRGAGEHHLLTLSATPIPRTLQMALIGLQQISIIATPPARRQPIRTSLDQFDDTRIRTALMREKGRSGQSFVVVPRIEDMATLAKTLRRIVPDLTLVEAHGKLPAAEIDQAMVSFAAGKGDILLATNIIEAGLDVPRANTMIVWRADRFGLAQLHQLRGRVGRSNRRGQVIVLTANSEAIAERTLKRLRTLAAFDQLGAGFDISAQDLDMRGAGELLGDDQAGHAKLIGIDLYQNLLVSALRKARGEDVERWSPVLNLGATGSLPASWIPEPDLRIALYVRLSRIEVEAELQLFEEEVVDRFGPLPRLASALLDRAHIRLSARALRISRIDAGDAAIALTLRKDSNANMATQGLLEKDDRWLLKARTSKGSRTIRVQALLEALAC